MRLRTNLIFLVNWRCSEVGSSDRICKVTFGMLPKADDTLSSSTECNLYRTSALSSSLDSIIPRSLNSKLGHTFTYAAEKSKLLS